jgi:hypothetical protein
MKFLLRLSLIFSIIILLNPSYASTSTENFKGTWAGIEVMGVQPETAEQIRNLIPIKKGDTFSSLDKEELDSWCNKIKTKTKFKDVNCSFIGFANSDFYYNVQNVNSKSKKYRTISKSFSKIPNIPIHIDSLLSEWDERFMFLFKTGIDPKEFDEQGFLDSQDPKLHVLAQKLSNETYKYNNILLEIIRYSNNSQKRSRAATLLSWSKQPKNLSYVLKWDLLSDPSEEVRNNLARSMFVILNKVHDKKILDQSIQSFCNQARLPSHIDRNKALGSLQKILKENPDLIGSVNKECKSTINYISQSSILPNVGGVAKDLLNTLGTSKNG